MFQSLYATLRRSRALLLVSIPLATGFTACGDDSGGGSTAGTGGAAAGGGAGQAAAGTGGSTAGGTAAGAGGAGAGGASGGGAGQAGAAAGNGGGDLYGYFDVALNPASEETGAGPNTSVIGKLYDGKYPTPNAWETKAEASGCKLSTPKPLFCQPSCTSGVSVCIAENTCSPYPTAVTVGKVTVTGVGSTPFDMEPIVNNYQPPAGTTIPFPPCAPGAEVKVAAAGGNGRAPFMVATTCVPPVEAAAEVEIKTGQPLMLTWNAPADPSKTRMQIKLDISHHGGTKGVIECDVPDNGSLAIPAAQVDALVELGVSGFPTVLLTRVSKGAGTGPAANVALNVLASFRQAVKIPGLTSCASNDADCPMGQKCQEDLKCE